MKPQKQKTLQDTFTLDHGKVFMSGTQALARLPLQQRLRDVRAGLNTAGFISGYRGSPLAGYDMILARIKHLLDAQQITFVPAINEELAATAIIGTQQVAAQADVNCDGVFSLWYGKGPGLDRAGDALKHANSMGSTPHGGALIVVGDDHNAISSAMAHQSEQLFASWMMPVLHASNIAEILDFGLLGWAMSRFSGCYVGLKIESEIIESAASVQIDSDRPQIFLPDFEHPPGGFTTAGPISSLKLKPGCRITNCPPRWLLQQQIPLIKSYGAQKICALASSPAARLIFQSARPWLTWVSTKRELRRLASVFTKSACHGRWRAVALLNSPLVWKKCWSLRKSAAL